MHPPYKKILCKYSKKEIVVQPTWVSSSMVLILSERLIATSYN